MNKFIVSVSLLTLWCVGCALVKVEDAKGLQACVDGYTWSYTVKNGEAIIESGERKGARRDCAVSPQPVGHVTIPSMLGGVSVTGIGERAFSGCRGLTSVTIPEGVTSIGWDAFSGCSGLKSVTIPEGVTRIGGSAFSECSRLASVMIPQSVTSIGWRPFYGTPFDKNLSDGMVILGSVLFEYRGECPSTVAIPRGVTSIGDDAFIRRSRRGNCKTSALTACPSA